MKITPLRRGLVKYLDEGQLYNLKKKLYVELKLLKFLSVHKVADIDCLSFARDENNDFIFTDQSARFYAKKYARTLFDEELVDVYLIKYTNGCGRGENIYTINENGLRLLGINEEFEAGLNDIEKYLKLTQYIVYRKEQLINEGYTVFNVYQNPLCFHIKYGNTEDIFNEYVFVDEYRFKLKFSEFMKDHNPYNDSYKVLIDAEPRGKELNAIVSKSICPIIVKNLFKLVDVRNKRGQKTFRPVLEIIGG